MEDKVAIGKILKVHGVKGQCVVYSFSGEFLKEKYEKYYIGSENGSFEEVVFETMSHYKQDPFRYLVTLKGYSREHIDGHFVGLEIFVDTLKYDKLGEDEFFYKDLIGSAVWIEEALVGEVISVHNFGFHDVVEVKRCDEAPDAKKKRQHMFLPIQDDFLVEMDIPNKKLRFTKEAYVFGS